MLAIVVQAVLRVAGRALGTPFKLGLAIAAFVALFILNQPFPLVVLGAGAIGMSVALSSEDRARRWLGLKPTDDSSPLPPRPSFWSTLRTVAIGGLLWATPMILIAVTLGQGHVLWQIGSFFSQLAVVTFGGAYAVLAYMAQEAVQGFGWLAPGEMADGLGLAESTPGPLIMVTQFVGYLAASRDAAPFSPMVAGVLGAVLTTWVTFVPCFLWIFTFAPWIDRLDHARRLKAGLSALTAAIVGVIANLSVWFALHLLFGRVESGAVGPVTLQWPDVTTLDWQAAVLALGAAVLLFRAKLSVLWLLAVSAVAGLLLGLAG